MSDVNPTLNAPNAVQDELVQAMATKLGRDAVEVRRAIDYALHKYQRGRWHRVKAAWRLLTFADPTDVLRSFGAEPGGLCRVDPFANEVSSEGALPYAAN